MSPHHRMHIGLTLPFWMASREDVLSKEEFTGSVLSSCLSLKQGGLCSSMGSDLLRRKLYLLFVRFLFRLSQRARSGSQGRSD